jgi:predicted dehydrogenase
MATTEPVSNSESQPTRRKRNRSGSRSRVRYAVVGLGHIAQAAVLPAFRHAKARTELRALVSDDPDKLRELGSRYDVSLRHSYGEYDDLLRSGEIDAVYIALPNHLHREYTERAARAGIHVLCEKPMAVTEQDCRAMIRACEENDVQLMVAYRLHFEPANLRAAELARNGTLGDVRIFNSTFTMQVKPGDIRLQQETGGGTLYDIGIYCLNAVRYLFGSEPIEAFAFSASTGEPRFREVDEMTTAVLRYPDERLASFTVSFGASDVSAYRLVGTEGDLRVEPAYEYAGPLKHHLTVGGKTRERTFRKRDQFAAELDYFSRCIAEKKAPEPSGKEGLADVQIIQALLRSAETGRPVNLDLELDQLPSKDQEYAKPPTRKPELVKTESPSM